MEVGEEKRPIVVEEESDPIQACVQMLIDEEKDFHARLEQAGSMLSQIVEGQG